nr:hypothetical protein Iba_chr07dCG4020 [Ipomoea batatas]
MKDCCRTTSESCTIRIDHRWSGLVLSPRLKRLREEEIKKSSMSTQPHPRQQQATIVPPQRGKIFKQIISDLVGTGNSAAGKAGETPARNINGGGGGGRRGGGGATGGGGTSTAPH